MARGGLWHVSRGGGIDGWSQGHRGHEGGAAAPSKCFGGSSVLLGGAMRARLREVPCHRTMPNLKRTLSQSSGMSRPSLVGSSDVRFCAQRQKTRYGLHWLDLVTTLLPRHLHESIMR